MHPDDDREPNALVPVEQDVVPFYGHMLVAVRLADGRIAAVLRWLCEGLGLNLQSQLRHIRGRAVLNDGLIVVRVATDGGPQSMQALTLHAMPGWLFSVDERRVRPEVRDDVILFQRECTDVLAEHFANKPRQTLPETDTLVPSEPIARPEGPAADADRATWIEYHHAMVAWLRWQDDVDHWRREHEHRYSALAQRQGALEDRMESVEEVTRLIPEILDRLGPETLSPEHQATIKNLAKRLNELAGFSYAMIYGELNAAFHVGKYSDIPAARWPDVLVWFKARIDAAERRHTR